MQWLNVSYSVWVNVGTNASDTYFKGRFKSLVIEDAAGWQEVARYVHLNPVRLPGLELDKRQQAASRRTGIAAPSASSPVVAGVAPSRIKIKKEKPVRQSSDCLSKIQNKNFFCKTLY